MSPRLEDLQLVTSWTNGQKAVVQLLENRAGEKVIMKTYRRGFLVPMFREYLVTKYVSKRLPIVPKVIAFQPLRKRFFLSFLKGQRVLEWVLQHFGEQSLSLADFHSFHGLQTNTIVAEAFSRFRDSTSQEAQKLKQAIRESYRCLHRIGILHGTADPRNVIYDQSRVFIIDFDHARPSLNPGKFDLRALKYWFGIGSP